MADEPVGTQGGAASGAGAGGSGGAASGGGGGSAIPAAPVSDQDFLAQGGGTSTAVVQAKEAPAAEAAEPEAALLKPGAFAEEGEPEWFNSLKDAEQAKQARELFKNNQEYQKQFKTPAEMAEFFKELPGGREQVTALLTLGKEVGELDSAIEGSDFNGHLNVAERVIGQAPENAASLTRAWAQTLAKSQPEAWRQVSAELVNNTLKAQGIAVDLNALLGGIKALRLAVQNQDADSLGREVAALIAEPEAPKGEDPNLVRTREEARTAGAERDKALQTTWQNTVNRNVEQVEQMLRQDIGTTLSKVLMDSTKAEVRQELTTKILAEIDGQLKANDWLRSQIRALVGFGDGPNLRATAENFAQALELSKGAAKPLVSAATRKVVSAWAKEFVAGNKTARERARGGPASPNLGGGTQPKPGRGQVTEQMVRDENVSDEELLNQYSRK